MDVAGAPALPAYAERLALAYHPCLRIAAEGCSELRPGSLGPADAATAAPLNGARTAPRDSRGTLNSAPAAAWGLLVAPQFLLVVHMMATVLMHTSCAGALGTVTALLIYPWAC
ncbi:hypothetical protein ABT168_04220 [Streptomyces sp. NPDC001793]|uniref:hypothetical protein n=1 Tax=Streptomyces sp. NPDC001793 TaxID=3154657 RepID=UPI00333456C4